MGRRGHGTSSNLEAYAVVRQFQHHDDQAVEVKFMMHFNEPGRVLGMVKRAMKGLLEHADLNMLQFDMKALDPALRTPMYYEWDNNHVELHVENPQMLLSGLPSLDHLLMPPRMAPAAACSAAEALQSPQHDWKK